MFAGANGSIWHSICVVTGQEEDVRSVMSKVAAATQISQIKAVIQRASDATGVGFDYLLRTAERESSLKPGAKAHTSSATGLFQFIDQTWLATLKQSGNQFGYGDYAEAIKRLPDGRHIVPDPAQRKEILALRKDPKAASLMAGAYTRDAADRLSEALGRKPLTGELYVAHFLGPGGAVKLIEAAQATPDKPAAELFPRAARANKPAFYNADGTRRSAHDLYEKLVMAYGPGKSDVADIGTVAVKDAPPRQPVAQAPPAPDPSAVQPASAQFRLASHFQNVRADAVTSFTGRPFQSLFVTTDAPAPDGGPETVPPLRTPGSGPLVIIPAGSPVTISPAGAPLSETEVNAGAIAAPERSGPLNIVPRRTTGLLEQRQPFHTLFRTDAQGA